MRWIVTEKRSSRSNIHLSGNTRQTTRIQKKPYSEKALVWYDRGHGFANEIRANSGWRAFPANPAVIHRPRAVLMSRANAPII
jgi:hypothetical protein